MATAKTWFLHPFAKLDPRPSPGDPIVKVRVDKGLAPEAVTYAQASGRERTVHIEQVLEYNKDPDFLRDRLLYGSPLKPRSGSRPARYPGARSFAVSARRGQSAIAS